MEKPEIEPDEFADEHPRTASLLGCIGAVTLASIVAIVNVSQKLLDTKERVKELFNKEDDG